MKQQQKLNLESELSGIDTLSEDSLPLVADIRITPKRFKQIVDKLIARCDSIVSKIIADYKTEHDFLMQYEEIYSLFDRTLKERCESRFADFFDNPNSFVPSYDLLHHDGLDPKKYNLGTQRRKYGKGLLRLKNPESLAKVELNLITALSNVELENVGVVEVAVPFEARRLISYTSQSRKIISHSSRTVVFRKGDSGSSTMETIPPKAMFRQLLFGRVKQEDGEVSYGFISVIYESEPWTFHLGIGENKANNWQLEFHDNYPMLGRDALSDSSKELRDILDYDLLSLVENKESYTIGDVKELTSQAKSIIISLHRFLTSSGKSFERNIQEINSQGTIISKLDSILIDKKEKEVSMPAMETLLSQVVEGLSSPLIRDRGFVCLPLLTSDKVSKDIIKTLKERNSYLDYHHPNVAVSDNNLDSLPKSYARHSQTTYTDDDQLVCSSHWVPSEQAEEHDFHVLNVLKSFDLNDSVNLAERCSKINLDGNAFFVVHDRNGDVSFRKLKAVFSANEEITYCETSRFSFETDASFLFSLSLEQVQSRLQGLIDAIQAHDSPFPTIEIRDYGELDLNTAYMQTLFHYLEGNNSSAYLSTYLNEFITEIAVKPRLLYKEKDNQIHLNADLLREI